MVADDWIALLAVTEITPGVGAIPVVHGALPAPEVATAPGVMVIEHEPPAGNIGPQVDEDDVPAGQDGVLMDNPVAGASPVFVMVITRCAPEANEFRVSPATLSARLAELKVRIGPFCITPSGPGL